MAGDEKPAKKKYDPTKKPSTVGECFLKFCLTTSVRGVGRIFKSKSRLLTILWACVVLAFLIFSVYQVGVIVKNYLNFDTTTEQKIKIPRRVPFPDITLCNLQPFRRQPEIQLGDISKAEMMVVEYFDNVTMRMKKYGTGVSGSMNWDRSSAPFDHDSEDPTDEHSGKANPNDYQADEAESNDTKQESVDRHTLEGIISTTAAIYQNVNQTMRDTLGHEKNMIDHCVFTVQDKRRLATDQCDIKKFKHPQYFNCYTISRNHSKPGTILDLSLQMFLDDEIHLFYPDMYRVDKESQLHGVKVIVHEPGSYPNVGKKGFNVPPGMAANFYLTTTRWQSQPPPYGKCNHDNSKKHIETWEGDSFKYEKDTCQDQCVQEHINSICHCVDAGLVHPRKNTRDLPFCVDIHTDLGTTIDRVACMFDMRLRPPITCLEDCTFPCHRYDYGTTETMSEWPHESFHLPLYSSMKDKRNLTIDVLERIEKTKKDYNIHDHKGSAKFDMQKISKSKNTLMNTDGFQRNFVSVMVQKETFEVIIVEEKPEISLAKLFSSIGGIMCFWMGITLITLMEIVELIYDLIMFCRGKRSSGKPEGKGEETPINDAAASKEEAAKV